MESNFREYEGEGGYLSKGNLEIASVLSNYIRDRCL